MTLLKQISAAALGATLVSSPVGVYAMENAESIGQTITRKAGEEVGMIRSHLTPFMEKLKQGVDTGFNKDQAYHDAVATLEQYKDNAVQEIEIFDNLVKQRTGSYATSFFERHPIVYATLTHVGALVAGSAAALWWKKDSNNGRSTTVVHTANSNPGTNDTNPSTK